MEDWYGASGKNDSQYMRQDAPTTLGEKCPYNAAVTDFGTILWMSEVLACFDSIVISVWERKMYLYAISRKRLPGK